MPSCLVLVLSFLVWVTSKIIFCLFELIVIEKTIGSEDANESKRALKSTITFTVIGSIVFISALLSAMNHFDCETCDYINENVFLIIGFDLLISYILVVVMNYLLCYKERYIINLEPMPSVSFDPTLFNI